MIIPHRRVGKKVIWEGPSGRGVVATFVTPVAAEQFLYHAGGEALSVVKSVMAGDTMKPPIMEKAETIN